MVADGSIEREKINVFRSDTHPRVEYNFLLNLFTSAISGANKIRYLSSKVGAISPW